MNSDLETSVKDIKLADIISILYVEKWKIISSVSVVTALTVFISLCMPDMYQSEALLAPTEGNDSVGLSSLANQLGGLASLTGVNLNAQKADTQDLALEILKSRAFVNQFIEKHNLLVPLFAAKRWNAASNELEIDPDVYDLKNKKWLARGGSLGGAFPSKEMAYNKFIDYMSVKQFKDTGFVKISVRFLSPKYSKEWVDWLVDDINSTVRNMDVSEAAKNIEYLENQISQTSVGEMQQIFYQLIQKQMQTVMLANVREGYVFKIIDPPVVPEKKVGPKRELFAILAFFMSTVFFAGGSVVLRVVF